MANLPIYNLSYGVYAVLSDNGEKPSGCIVNTVFQISSEGPTIAVSMNKDNLTHTLFEKNKKFSVAILSEETDSNVVSSLGFSSGKDKFKLDGLKYSDNNGYTILDENCAGHLLCEIVDSLDCNTHTLFIAKVVSSVECEKKNVMTYKYYRELRNGGVPKNAPTYRETDKTGNYVCDVCGYTHTGDINNEPDDFKCPICKVDKTHFKLK